MRDPVSSERRAALVSERKAKRWGVKMDALEVVLRRWCDAQTVMPGIWYYRKNDHHAIVLSEYTAVVARPDHEMMKVLAARAESCQDWFMVVATMVSATVVNFMEAPDLNDEIVRSKPVVDALRQVLLAEGCAFYEHEADEKGATEGAHGEGG